MTNQEKLLFAFKERRIEDFQKLVQYRDIDVDYFYGEPDNGTLLNLACWSPGYERYVSILIQSGARIWRKNEETGKLEIHEVFNRPDQPDEDMWLTVWFRIYFSSISENDNANLMKVAVEENDIAAMKFLAHSCSLVPDRFKGQHLILLQGSVDAIRLFIKYFDVDKEFQKDSHGPVFSCREIILQKYPELEADLPTRSWSELGKILCLYLEKGVPELFIRRIAYVSPKSLNYNEHFYLHVACDYNYIDVVDALLKKNVHLNEVVTYFNKFARTVTPIMVAAFRGHYEIFRKLFIMPQVELQNATGSGSVLHLVLLGMQYALDKNYPTNGHCMILEFLLTKPDDPPAIEHSGPRLELEHTDKKNRTALHYALKFNNEFAIKLLLGAGAEMHYHDRSILTSISATIIERYFDDCIRSTEGTRWTQGYTDAPIIFHYKIIIQLYILFFAFESDGNFYVRKLFKHPLMKSWLHLMWCMIRKCYYVNLAFYLSFCLALSTYIFQSQHCSLSSTNFNASATSDTEINRDASSILCDLSLWIWLVTLVLYIILIIRELYQLSFSIRVYFGIPENWLEMTMIVVIGFLFANETNKYFAASAILTSWIGLILLLGKQPSFSIYIEMFKTVALNFAKFLLLYSVLVASFAYSFFILFRNKISERASSQNQICVDNTDGTNENSMNLWQDLQMSFFKSIVMMTGEFDASTLPLDSNFGYGHALFILFVFLVSMVIYSLLNGLAVSDTRSIMEDAEVVALVSRVKLIYQISKLEQVFAFLYNKLILEWTRSDTEPVYVYPTKSNRIEINGKNAGKMPSFIVRHAEQILEKRKQSELAKNRNGNLLTDVTKTNSSEHQLVNKLVRQFSEQISNLKLEIDAKNIARDEKLLQSVDQRFDKMMNGLLNDVRQEVHILKNKN